MDTYIENLKTVRQLHDTETGRAWQALLIAKYEDIKERLVFEENRDVLGAQAQVIQELIAETSTTVTPLRNTYRSTAQT
jgi:hypothetical protein